MVHRQRTAQQPAQQPGAAPAQHPARMSTRWIHCTIIMKCYPGPAETASESGQRAPENAFHVYDFMIFGIYFISWNQTWNHSDEFRPMKSLYDFINIWFHNNDFNTCFHKYDFISWFNDMMKSVYDIIALTSYKISSSWNHISFHSYDIIYDLMILWNHMMISCTWKHIWYPKSVAPYYDIQIHQTENHVTMIS